jgi:hypothetical protein
LKVNNIIENCNSVKIEIEKMQNNSYQNEDNLTNENTYIFINEFEETELLEGKLNNNITELNEIDYKIDGFDEFNLLNSDSEKDNIHKFYINIYYMLLIL